MIDIEVVEALIEYKEKRLAELREHGSTIQIEAELRSLKLYQARFEIAKRYKLESDPDWTKIDYENIENRKPSVSDNLTQETLDEIEEYRRKIQQIKSEGSIEYVSFINLANQVKTEIFQELNGYDYDTYQTKKEEHLVTYKKLIEKTEQDSVIEYNNYEFALDAKSQFEGFKGRLSLREIYHVIDLLNTNLDIEEEKYKELIDLLSSSINYIGEHADNQEAVNIILDRVNRSNYILRVDLSSKIKSDKLQLKSEELPDAYQYLERNYDHLDEADREKVYSLLRNKLKEDSENLEQIDQVNQILLNAADGELKERIRKEFQYNTKVEFKDVHANSYSQLVQERIQKLESKKAKIAGKDSKLEMLDARNVARVKEIEKEIEELKSLKIDFSDNELINSLDEKYNAKSDQVIELEKQIAKLRELQQNLKSNFQKKRINNKIDHLYEKISKLQTKQVKIMDKQKRIMVPKVRINQRRGTMERHYESRIETFNEYSEDYSKMAETTREINGMFSGVKAAFYDYKAGKYAKKSERNQAIYNYLKTKKIRVTGRTERILHRDDVQHFRDDYYQQGMEQVV